MGDRTNWGFVNKFGAPVINLYGHWAGSMRHELLAKGLVKALPRLSDPSYATRIVISQIVGDDWDSEYSWGLDVDQLGDNEHPYLMVFWETQVVVEIPMDWHDTGKPALDKAWLTFPQAKTWTIEEFIREYAITTVS